MTKQARGARLFVRHAVATSLSLLAMTLVVAPLAVHAQALDAPYVPTPQNVVDKMLEMAKVGPADYVIDLGSGDGRIVITAAKKFGARGMGVDLDGNLVSEARRQAERQGVRDKAEFHARNLFTTDIAQASVLTLYLFPRILIELRPRLFNELKPGTRVVSHEFDFGNWKPDAKATVSVPDKPYGAPFSDVLLWIVPANAAGTWRSELDTGGAFLECELVLEQRFQELRGTARLAGQPARIESARLDGDRVKLALAGHAGGRELRVDLHARIAGEVMNGAARIAGAAGETKWNAIRTARGKINIE